MSGWGVQVWNESGDLLVDGEYSNWHVSDVKFLSFIDPYTTVHTWVYPELIGEDVDVIVEPSFVFLDKMNTVYHTWFVEKHVFMSDRIEGSFDPATGTVTVKAVDAAKMGAPGGPTTYSVGVMILRKVE